MVHQSEIKAESYNHRFVMVALVVSFFAGGKVYLCQAIVTTIVTSGVAASLGTGHDHFLNGWIVGTLGKGGMGTNMVVAFHRQFHKLQEVLGFVGLVF
jgi:hypothetical protein